jgi:hypothetical protein
MKIRIIKEHSMRGPDVHHHDSVRKEKILSLNQLIKDAGLNSKMIAIDLCWGNEKCPPPGMPEVAIAANKQGKGYPTREFAQAGAEQLSRATGMNFTVHDSGKNTFYIVEPQTLEEVNWEDHSEHGHENPRTPGRRFLTWDKMAKRLAFQITKDIGQPKISGDGKSYTWNVGEGFRQSLDDYSNLTIKLEFEVREEEEAARFHRVKASEK